MTSYNLIKPELINLRNNSDLNEKWVQDKIAEDPTILGLGDLVLKDYERMQPRAGRLDLLLQDPESNKRYEVEIQLGKTDESHIIRTIEYWDIEKKRYPQYEHCAVIIAEDITSRFLNVISLFNGNIPIIAIQMNAYKIDSTNIALLFTKIIDEMNIGLIEEDEEKAVTDRAYWEGRATKSTVAIADDIIKTIKSFDSSYELKYNKFYIGLAKNGIVNNFIKLRAKKKFLQLGIRLKQSGDILKKLNESDLDVMDYNEKEEWCRIRLNEKDLKNPQSKLLVDELLKMSYNTSVSPSED